MAVSAAWDSSAVSQRPEGETAKGTGCQRSGSAAVMTALGGANGDRVLDRCPAEDDSQRLAFHSSSAGVLTYHRNLGLEPDAKPLFDAVLALCANQLEEVGRSRVADVNVEDVVGVQVGHLGRADAVFP